MENKIFDLKAVVKSMQELSLDAIIASSPENVFYTTGLPTRQAEYNPILFTLSNQYPFFSVITEDGEEHLIAWKGFDFNYTWVSNFVGILSPTEAMENLIKILKNHSKRKRVGIESTAPFFLTEVLMREGFEVRAADSIFTNMRMKKTQEELLRINRAVQIAEQAVLRTIESIAPGISEIELVRRAKIHTIELGAMGWDHMTISVGKSDPEYPGVGVIAKEGDIFRVDIGAIYLGYTSDVSRNASLGQPIDYVKRVYEAIIDSINYCEDKIQPGQTTASEIYRMVQQRLEGHGYKLRSHYVGHGIGIQTEEYPLLKPGYEQVIKEGMVLNIEVWVGYEPSRSLGLEDTFYVDKNGLVKISKLDRELFVI
jgi:Xaa-Pro aminopeptidase